MRFQSISSRFAGFIASIAFPLAAHSAALLPPTVSLFGLPSFPANSSAPGSPLFVSAFLSGASGTPTGTVDFVLLDTNAAATPLCTAVALSSGSASCSFSTPLPAGNTWQVRVDYPGDVNYSGTSNFNPFLSKYLPTITQTGLPATLAPATAVTMTATFSNGTGTPPSGSADFVLLDMATFTPVTQCAAVAINGSGNATCSFTGPGVGGWEIQVNYGGDPANQSVSQAFTFSVPLVVTTTADSGAGSLRAAINTINSSCSGTTVNFALPGPSFKIALLSPLPALTCGGATIDGFSQPGSAMNTAIGGSDNATIKVELDGSSCGTCDGLTMSTAATVRGLSIHSFSGSGINVNGGFGANIYGNYIGTDPSGTGFGNNIGITVGGGTYAYIGASPVGQGNLISANTTHGVLVSGGAATINNNLIGGQRSGNPPNGNGGSGIFFQSANYSTNQVDGNYIRYNAAKGAVVDPGTFKALFAGNSIHGNGSIGIDLNNDGPTANDEAAAPYDTDSGPNGLQNYPVITSVVPSGANTVISGYLKSTDVSQVFGGMGNIHIELFSNPVLIANTEGATFLGAVPTAALVPTVGDGGFVTFSTVVPALVNNVSATVLIDTCGDGCTASSEYSPMVAVAGPTITLTPTTLNFGSAPQTLTSVPQIVTILNNGPGPVTLGSITTTGDFGFTSACPTPLVASATCIIQVTFTPLLAGLRTGTLSVPSNATPNPGLVSLSGTGVAAPAAIITVLPGVVEFGGQVTGTDSAPQFITVTNAGSAPLTLGAIVSTLADFVLRPSSVAPGRACGTSLAPAASCDIAVVFHPTATGIRDGQVTVANSVTTDPVAVRVVGTGNVPPRQLSMVAQLTFGAQPVGTTSAGQPLAITNNTAGPVTVSGLTASGDFSISDSCTTIAAHATCSGLVFFQPSAVGARTGTITVHALADSVPYVVNLSGTGTANPNPALRVSPTQLGFGNVIYGSSANQSITLSNVGQVPVLLSSITMTGNSDFTEVNSCGATIAVGVTCNVNVNFAPHAIGGRSGTFSVISNATGSPQKVDLTGTGCRYFSPAAARFFLTSC